MTSSGSFLTIGRIWLTNSVDSIEEENEMKYYHHIENDLNIVYWKHIYHEYSFHSWMEHLNIILYTKITFEEQNERTYEELFVRFD